MKWFLLKCIIPLFVALVLGTDQKDGSVSWSFLKEERLKVVIFQNNETYEVVLDKIDSLLTRINFTGFGDNWIPPRVHHFKATTGDRKSWLSLYDKNGTSYVYGTFDVDGKIGRQKLYLESSHDGRHYNITSVPQLLKPIHGRQTIRKIKDNRLDVRIYVDKELVDKLGSDKDVVYCNVMGIFKFLNALLENIVFGKTKDGQLITGINMNLIELAIENGSTQYNYGDKAGVDTNTLLSSFTETVNSSDIGVAIMITGRMRLDENVASAWTGGILKNGYNTMVLSMGSDDSTIVPLFDAFRYLAHEFGHLLGVAHDNENAIVETLMYSHVTDGRQQSHHTFSQEAKDQVAKIFPLIQSLKRSENEDEYKTTDIIVYWLNPLAFIILFALGAGLGIRMQRCKRNKKKSPLTLTHGTEAGRQLIVIVSYQQLLPRDEAIMEMEYLSSHSQR